MWLYDIIEWKQKYSYVARIFEWESAGSKKNQYLNNGYSKHRNL